jgi:hypothetical protein
MLGLQLERPRRTNFSRVQWKVVSKRMAQSDHGPKIDSHGRVE